VISFRWILIRLVLVAFLCSVLITEVGAQGVFIDSPDRRDHVYDSTRDILYIATTNRDVERYDVNSGTFLSRFTSPGTRSYNGITISPDDSSIYVAIWRPIPFHLQLDVYDNGLICMLRQMAVKFSFLNQIVRAGHLESMMWQPSHSRPGQLGISIPIFLQRSIATVRNSQ